MADEAELAAVDWIDAAARKYIRDPAELRRANQITAALLRTPAAPDLAHHRRLIEQVVEAVEQGDKARAIDILMEMTWFQPAGQQP